MDDIEGGPQTLCLFGLCPPHELVWYIYHKRIREMVVMNQPSQLSWSPLSHRIRLLSSYRMVVDIPIEMSAFQ